MKLDPGMHICMHLVSFGKVGVTKILGGSGLLEIQIYKASRIRVIVKELETHEDMPASGADGVLNKWWLNRLVKPV
jgi:hypothetical protein